MAPACHNLQPRESVYTPVRPCTRHKRRQRTIHRPEPQKRRTSWRPPLTPPHQWRTKNRMQTSTSTTMSPWLPSWRPARTGLQPRGQWPDPHFSACFRTRSPPALRGTLPLRPLRRIFAAPIPLWDWRQKPTQPPRGMVGQEGCSKGWLVSIQVQTTCRSMGSARQQRPAPSVDRWKGVPPRMTGPWGQESLVDPHGRTPHQDRRPHHGERHV